ncbi:MAG: hypothetical protein M1812_001902 [Candelaria pacifica]|nr:MAG: hypothetical protein M1812_001902 [Candelaria pacifica]
MSDFASQFVDRLIDGGVSTKSSSTPQMHSTYNAIQVTYPRNSSKRLINPYQAVEARQIKLDPKQPLHADLYLTSPADSTYWIIEADRDDGADGFSYHTHTFVIPSIGRMEKFDQYRIHFDANFPVYRVSLRRQYNFCRARHFEAGQLPVWSGRRWGSRFGDVPLPVAGPRPVILPPSEPFNWADDVEEDQGLTRHFSAPTTVWSTPQSSPQVTEEDFSGDEEAPADVLDVVTSSTAGVDEPYPILSADDEASRSVRALGLDCYVEARQPEATNCLRGIDIDGHQEIVLQKVDCLGLPRLQPRTPNAQTDTSILDNGSSPHIAAVANWENIGSHLEEMPWEFETEELPPNFHHYNVYAKAISHPTNTPPEVSLWLSYKGYTALIADETFINVRSFRIWKAQETIDPVEYDGDLPLGLYWGHRFLEAVKGHVRITYQLAGSWMTDIPRPIEAWAPTHKEPADRPALDMNLHDISEEEELDSVWPEDELEPIEPSSEDFTGSLIVDGTGQARGSHSEWPKARQRLHASAEERAVAVRKRDHLSYRPNTSSPLALFGDGNDSIAHQQSVDHILTADEDAKLLGNLGADMVEEFRSEIFKQRGISDFLAEEQLSNETEAEEIGQDSNQQGDAEEEGQPQLQEPSNRSSKEPTFWERFRQSKAMVDRLSQDQLPQTTPAPTSPLPDGGQANAYLAGSVGTQVKAEQADRESPNVGVEAGVEVEQEIAAPSRTYEEMNLGDAWRQFRKRGPPIRSILDKSKIPEDVGSKKLPEESGLSQGPKVELELKLDSDRITEEQSSHARNFSGSSGTTAAETITPQLDRSSENVEDKPWPTLLTTGCSTASAEVGLSGCPIKLETLSTLSVLERFESRMSDSRALVLHCGRSTQSEIGACVSAFMGLVFYKSLVGQRDFGRLTARSALECLEFGKEGAISKSVRHEMERWNILSTRSVLPQFEPRMTGCTATVLYSPRVARNMPEEKFVPISYRRFDSTVYGRSDVVAGDWMETLSVLDNVGVEFDLKVKSLGQGLSYSSRQHKPVGAPNVPLILFFFGFLFLCSVFRS